MPTYDPNYDPILERRRADARARQEDRASRGDMPWPFGRGDALGREAPSSVASPGNPIWESISKSAVPDSIGDFEEKTETFRTPGKTITASQEVYRPDPNFRMRGVLDALPDESPGEQRSGSEKSDSSEKHSAPPNSFTNDDLGRRFSRNVDQSEYSGLRANAQFGRPINISPTSMSLADLEGDERTRQILQARNRSRLEDINLDDASRPNPMEETLRAQTQTRAYERGLPAGLDDMNRLGVGGLTRGEAMGEDIGRSRQRLSQDFQREQMRNAQEVARLSHPVNPSQTVSLQRQQAGQELQKKYFQRLHLIDQAQALPPGHPNFLSPQDAAEEIRAAKEEFAMLSNQAAGKSVYTPAQSTGF